MSKITVELPDDLREFIETKVQRGEFASVSHYVTALVETARKNKSEIEAALIEGLESGEVEEWSSQEWANVKRRVIDQHSAH